MCVPNVMAIHQTVVQIFHFTNHKCQLHGGTREKAGGPPKAVGCHHGCLSVQHFMAFHLSDKYFNLNQSGGLTDPHYHLLSYANPQVYNQKLINLVV